MKRHHAAVNKSIVKLAAKSGSKANGTLYLEDHHGGVIITGKVSGLKPGKHGFHIHETGDCKAKDAASAGGHFQVAGQSHGDKEVAGSHTGDLGNIEVGKDGSTEINVFVKDVTLGAGEHSIANRSLVIHADSDDLKSQPAGNSGKRIACGVIELKVCAQCGKEGCKMHCQKSGGCSHEKCEGGCKKTEKKEKDCGCDAHKN